MPWRNPGNQRQQHASIGRHELSIGPTADLGSVPTNLLIPARFWCLGDCRDCIDLPHLENSEKGRRVLLLYRKRSGHQFLPTCGCTMPERFRKSHGQVQPKLIPAGVLSDGAGDKLHTTTLGISTSVLTGFPCGVCGGILAANRHTFIGLKPFGRVARVAVPW